MTIRTASCSCGQLTAITSADSVRVSVCCAGATVYYTSEGREDGIVIPVDAFADPAFPAPTFSVYEERMHTCVEIPAGIEHMA